MKRAEILADATRATCSERPSVHGDPVEQHIAAARLWSAYLGVEVVARDVAVCMALLKVSRVMTGDAGHGDHYADAAAYLAIAGECEGR